VESDSLIHHSECEHQVQGFFLSFSLSLSHTYKYLKTGQPSYLREMATRGLCSRRRKLPPVAPYIAVSAGIRDSDRCSRRLRSVLTLIFLPVHSLSSFIHIVLLDLHLLSPLNTSRCSSRHSFTYVKLTCMSLIFQSLLFLKKLRTHPFHCSLPPWSVLLISCVRTDRQSPVDQASLFHLIRPTHSAIIHSDLNHANFILFCL